MALSFSSYQNLFDTPLFVNTHILREAKKMNIMFDVIDKKKAICGYDGYGGIRVF